MSPKEIDMLLGYVVFAVAVICLIYWARKPHKHYFTTYDPNMCQYATCWCGAGISLEEAAALDIPIHWKSGGRIHFTDTYIAISKKELEKEGFECEC